MLYLKIKNICLNPILFFLIINIAFILILFLEYHFVLPNFYIDKVAAQLFINENPNSFIELNKTFYNSRYLIQNIQYHLCAICNALFIICLIFNINRWTKVKELKILQSKIFIFLFMNISYILWAYCAEYVFEIDVNKYIYPSISDSTFIVILGFHFLILLGAIFYYIFINISLVLFYIKKISYKFLKYSLILYIFILIFNISLCITSQFCWLYVILYFIIFTCLLISFNILALLKKDKRSYV